jgi:hypothetical protein
MERTPADYDGTPQGIIDQLRKNPHRTAESRFPNAGMTLLMAYFPEHEPIPFVSELHAMPQFPWEPEIGPLVIGECGLTAEELVIRIQVMMAREIFGSDVPEDIKAEMSDRIRMAAEVAAESVSTEGVVDEIEDFLRRQ